MTRPPEMTPSAVEQRLLEVARLSSFSLRPPPRVEMAPASIEARLRECAEMSAICLELASGPSRT